MLSTLFAPYSSVNEHPFHRIQKELNDSLVEFRNGLMATQGGLSLNIWRKEGEVILRLELPGFESEEIELDVIKDRLKLKAERRASEEGEAALKAERPFGKLEREIQLPFTIDGSRTEASYSKGILEVHLFAVAEEGPQRVSVQAR